MDPSSSTPDTTSRITAPGDLAERKRARLAERYQAALVDHVTDAIIVTTPDGTVTSWNPAAETIYRRSAEDALGTPVSEAVGAHVDPAELVAAGTVQDTVHRTADGSALTVRISAVEIEDSFLLISSDRTQLSRVTDHFRMVVDSLDEGVVVFHQDGHVMSANPAAFRLFGVEPSQVPTDHASRIRSFQLYDEDGNPVETLQRPIIHALRTGETIQHKILGIDRPDGRRAWFSGGTFLLNADDPENRAVLLSVADITAQRELNERLAHQAHHDHLTGLPNRAYVLELLGEALQSGSGGGVAAVCYIDLDGLKAINDSLGHHAGDTAIRTMAQLLRAALRAGDILGRVGGDEFLAVLRAPATRSGLEDIAAALHAALSQPLVIENVTQRISASVGIVVVADDERRGAEQLLRDADHAMYRAKIAGRGQSYFFDGP